MKFLFIIYPESVAQSFISGGGWISSRDGDKNHEMHLVVGGAVGG